MEVLRPFLEGKDLKRWRQESRGLWIIYTPKNRTSIDDYPAIRGWLMSFKEKLEKRATRQHWFELQQAQEAYSPHFERKKIVYPHFSQRPNFSLEETGAYSNDKSYIIPGQDLFLLAYLNSKAGWFYLSNLAPAVRGGFHELRVQYVEQLPVPEAGKAARSTIADAAKVLVQVRDKVQQIQRAFARRIPDLSPASTSILSARLKEWWLLQDFTAFRAEIKKTFKADIPLSERSDWEDWFNRDRAKIERLTSEILKAEHEIDVLVYGLFKLTPDEIAVLEASVSQTESSPLEQAQ